MKPVNIKKKYDIAYCIFVGVAFIVVIIWQIFHLPLPSWLLTDLPLTDSSFVILQIQVTIAVLPLAIIALITGMSKDTLYGVPVLKYVLRLRPVLLTYNSVAILQKSTARPEWNLRFTLSLMLWTGNSRLSSCGKSFD